MADVVSCLLSTHGLFPDPDEGRNGELAVDSGRGPKGLIGLRSWRHCKKSAVMGGFAAFLRMSK